MKHFLPTQSAHLETQVKHAPNQALTNGLCKLFYIAILVTLMTTSGTCWASGVTKVVSGLSTAVVTPNDVLMVIDVSDTSMAATGTNKKVEVQGLLQGFPAGSISQVTLSPTIFAAGSVAGASLSPTIFSYGAISGASLNPAILGARAISGATLSISGGFLSGVSVDTSDVFRFNELLGGASTYVIGAAYTAAGDQLRGRPIEFGGQPTPFTVQLPVLTSTTPFAIFCETSVSGIATRSGPGVGLTVWSTSYIQYGTGVSSTYGQTVFATSGNTGFVWTFKALSYGGTLAWKLMPTDVVVRRP